MIVLAAAMGLNNELGQESGVPLWDLPDEFGRFKESIVGRPIIMGRKSFDVVKKPIPFSKNIVITRNKDYDGNGAMVVNSLELALNEAGNHSDVYVIGGGDIFRMALPFADKMEISVIDAQFPDANAFFPDFDKEEWILAYTEKHEKDERHAYAFTFQAWVRKSIR